MFSVRYNSCIKLWRNRKRCIKIIKNKPFINKYNREGINFPSKTYDWKKIEKYNVAIALNVLYAKKREISILLVIKDNSNCENKLFF